MKLQGGESRLRSATQVCNHERADRKIEESGAKTAHKESKKFVIILPSLGRTANASRVVTLITSAQGGRAFERRVA